MSSREKPYRSKAPVTFFQIAQAALQSTFFLVHESGVTSFVLKDEQGKSFKVSLGGTHSCTCGGGKTEHCIHTVYVLLKIFKVLVDNPLIWQLSFIDSEINWLIRSRHNPITSSKQRIQKKQSSESVQRIDLNEEYGCPICQEDLKDLATLTYCKIGCGHNFHIKCMKIWAEHKDSNKDSITCPLCRCDWGPGVLNELNKQLRKLRKKPVIHSGSTCVGCGVAPITGNKFHCVVCPNFDFCRKCYSSFHKEHPFVEKNAPGAGWQPAIRINADAFAGREFSPEDYEMLQKLDEKPCLSEYLFNILQDTNPGTCYLCATDQNTRWKRLACGHEAHDVCVLQAIRDEKYLCPADRTPFLLGLGANVEARKDSVQSLTVNGVQVGGNNSIQFRMRKRPPVRKQANLSAGAQRPAAFDLPALIVTRLSKN